MSVLRQFALTRPCSDCPFRNDGKAIDLQSGRREEIIEALLRGQTSTFHCHKSVYRDDGRNHDEDGEFVPNDVCHCPGAAAVARKCGRDTQMVQIATRLGAISQKHFDEAAAATIEPDTLDINWEKFHL